IKRKLLGNFKHAYVDVLSRQQSAFNTQLLSAVRELAECCATLDHAVRVLLEQGAGAAGGLATGSCPVTCALEAVSGAASGGREPPEDLAVLDTGSPSGG